MFLMKENEAEAKPQSTNNKNKDQAGPPTHAKSRAFNHRVESIVYVIRCANDDDVVVVASARNNKRIVRGEPLYRS